MDFNNLNCPCQDSKKLGIIYIIINLVNGKKYVGQTCQDLSERIKQHQYCKVKSGIDAAIQEYGVENFSVEIIEKCPVEKLNEREIFWIAELNTKFPNGYNLTSGGTGGNLYPLGNRCEALYSRERRKKIMEQLRENKSVYISDLAKDFETSTMTIRRDLARLSEFNIVTLIHGGAVLNEGAGTFATVEARLKRMMPEKSKIASYCASLIKPGNVVYLDTGTTTMEIAVAISKRHNITVLTNSLPIQNILSDSEKIQLFAMPGIYNKEMGGFFGDMTCRMIRSFSIDIAFFGTDAIDIENGVTTPILKDQAVKMAILERANKKILVVDHTKIGKVNFAQVCPINALNMIRRRTKILSTRYANAASKSFSFK